MHNNNNIICVYQTIYSPLDVFFIISINFHIYLMLLLEKKKSIFY